MCVQIYTYVYLCINVADIIGEDIINNLSIRDWA